MFNVTDNNLRSCNEEAFKHKGRVFRVLELSPVSQFGSMYLETCLQNAFVAMSVDGEI